MSSVGNQTVTVIAWLAPPPSRDGFVDLEYDLKYNYGVDGPPEAKMRFLAAMHSQMSGEVETGTVLRSQIPGSVETEIDLERTLTFFGDKLSSILNTEYEQDPSIPWIADPSPETWGNYLIDRVRHQDRARLIPLKPNCPSRTTGGAADESSRADTDFH